MERIYIKDLKQHIGEEVMISGWVDVRRDMGKLIFLDLRDISGKVQMVALPSHKDAGEVAGKIRSEWVIEVGGLVNKRPEKMVKQDSANGDIEVEILSIKILGSAKELPFSLGTEVNLDTHLDHLPLTLRDKKYVSIFKVQAEVVKAFRSFFNSEGFYEFQAPKLIGDDAEGGANSFSIEYFGHIAHLAQSPQLYKQIMVGVFEKVFTVGNVYRAEKHSTTRHINEYTSLDMEMGFIKDHTDIMKMENRLLSFIIEHLKKECAEEFKILNAVIPDVPATIPSLSLREAQTIMTKETGNDCTQEPDLEPEHERWLCNYAKKNYNSDFIFVTNFPTTKRPFYTYRMESDPTYTNGGDLLFRGVEITTLAQRINEYDQLVASMKEKGLDPEKFSYYLQAFKYGMPPHGGFGLGLERFTAKLLGLENVKEATLFPRDINRIDRLLSV